MIINTAKTSIAFQGEAVSGVMDVRDLAPALLSTSNLLEEANRVVNGADSNVQLLVTSDFRKGSFEVGLELVQNLVEISKPLIAATGPANALQLLEMLGFAANTGMAGLSLTKLLKWLGGRPVENVVEIKYGLFELYAKGDSNPVQVIGAIKDMAHDSGVRKWFGNMVQPLSAPGIDRLTFRDGEHNDVESIEKEEQPYFEASAEPLRNINDTRFTVSCLIENAPLDSRFKWRLSYGDQHVAASMKDEVFQKRIDDGLVSFTKGDMLDIEMRFQQWEYAEGTISNEYDVIRVIQHRKKQHFTQLPLPDGGSA